MITATTLLLLIGAPVQAEIKYNVTAQGKKLGVLSARTTRTASAFIEQTQIKITQGDRSASVATTSESSLQGDWRKKTYEASGPGGKSSIIVTPTKDGGAHVVLAVAGQKRTKDIPKVTKTTTRDATITWWNSYTPKPGETVKYQRFDAQALNWVESTVRYVGPKSVTIGGKPRPGFEMERTEGGRKGTIIVDKGSRLIRMDWNGVVFERIYP